MIGWKISLFRRKLLVYLISNGTFCVVFYECKTEAVDVIKNNKTISETFSTYVLGLHYKSTSLV